MMKLNLLYRRLPGEVTIYEQELLYENERLIITRAPFQLSASLPAQAPWLKEQEKYQAIWFILPGEWHDLGKIYDPSGALQGYYCDIIRPARRTAGGLEIDDLILDLWVFPDGRYSVLDEDELAEALEQGWLAPSLAAKAHRELKRLIGEVQSGHFPPPVVKRFQI